MITAKLLRSAGEGKLYRIHLYDNGEFYLGSNLYPTAEQTQKEYRKNYERIRDGVKQEIARLQERLQHFDSCITAINNVDIDSEPEAWVK